MKLTTGRVISEQRVQSILKDCLFLCNEEIAEKYRYRKRLPSGRMSRKTFALSINEVREIRRAHNQFLVQQMIDEIKKTKGDYKKSALYLYRKKRGY